MQLIQGHTGSGTSVMAGFTINNQMTCFFLSSITLSLTSNENTDFHVSTKLQQADL